jgi:hypothetical protein
MFAVTASAMTRNRHIRIRRHQITPLFCEPLDAELMQSRTDLILAKSYLVRKPVKNKFATLFVLLSETSYIEQWINNFPESHVNVAACG